MYGPFSDEYQAVQLPMVSSPHGHAIRRVAHGAPDEAASARTLRKAHRWQIPAQSLPSKWLVSQPMAGALIVKAAGKSARGNFKIHVMCPGTFALCISCCLDQDAGINKAAGHTGQGSDFLARIAPTSSCIQLYTGR